ncbi:MAG: bifunctional deaminase-reductase domain protein [Frankiales bacterium]|nr:bifunctional deaminase-reductase domain protein [Frankiales bacterium]
MKLLHPTVHDVTAEDLFDLYDAPGPHLRAGFVVSVDGAVAVEGTSGPLGSAADKAAFRALRTGCDAVVVGAGTVRAEDYGPVQHRPAAAAWRAAHGRAAETPIVVVSRTGRLSPDARLLAGPVLLAVPEGVDVDLDVEVIRTTEPRSLVAALHARGLTRLLCEGGPSLLTSLLAAGVVDELCLTTSPTAVGHGPHLLGPAPRTDLSLLSLVHDDPGVLLSRWAVVRSAGD